MTLPTQNKNPPLRLLMAFQQAYPGLNPAYIMQAPGREMWVAASVERAEAFTIYSYDLEGRTSFDWRSAKLKRTLLNRPLPRWARYPSGVVVKLCLEQMDIAGFDAVVISDEAPGPRYDYSLGVMFAALMYVLNDRPYVENDLLAIVDSVRREYVEG